MAKMRAGTIKSLEDKPIKFVESEYSPRRGIFPREQRGEGRLLKNRKRTSWELQVVTGGTESEQGSSSRA
jgi:hypothetical protein